VKQITVWPAVIVEGEEEAGRAVTSQLVRPVEKKRSTSKLSERHWGRRICVDALGSEEAVWWC
jgi:hypothetical protein